MMTTKAQKEDKIKLYYWVYDDHSQGYAICDTSKSGKDRWIEQDILPDKKTRKNTLSELQKQYQEKGRQVTLKKLPIPSGLSTLTKKDAPKRDANAGADGVDELKKLISSCGEDIDSKKELLTLTATILAGYCARVCLPTYSDYIAVPDSRAPVITVSYADNAYHVLEYIARSLCVSTVTSGKLKANYQPIFPSKQKSRNLIDEAYLKLPHSSTRLPPQYRDTAFLVHSRFFSSSDLKDLQHKNPWVCPILFDCSAKKVLSTPVSIKGQKLINSDCLWDCQQISFVVARYIYYVARHSENKKKWREKISRYFEDAEELIAAYNQQPDVKPVKRPQKFHLELQMLALRLFVKSCKEDDSLSSEEGNALLSEWYNILLPGSCSIAQDSDYEGEDDSSTSIQTRFEHTLCRILEEGYPQHFLYVPPKGTFSLADSNDPNIHYWGYLRNYSPKKKKGSPKEAPFASLQFRRDRLESLLSNYSDNYDGADLYSDFCELDTDYRYDTKKARLPVDEKDSKTVDAMILNIRKMTFLPQDIRDQLLNQFPESEETLL